jgi:hypothetical protein
MITPMPRRISLISLIDCEFIFFQIFAASSVISSLIIRFSVPADFSSLYFLHQRLTYFIDAPRHIDIFAHLLTRRLRHCPLRNEARPAEPHQRQLASFAALPRAARLPPLRRIICRH